MRKLLSLLLVLALALTLCAGCSDPVDPSGDPEAPDDPEIPSASEYADRDVTGRNVAYVSMNIKGYGKIKLLLDATSAPRTVANFLTLAKAGFYDGLDFYAAQQMDATSAVIFGGDPTVNGGTPSYDNVKGEFAYNGIDNDLKIKRGVITMFHSGSSLDDASSAFFFANSDIAGLDGYYAPFGYVIDGYQIIEEMLEIGIYYTEQTGLILKNRRPVISSITVEQDIDYSLVSDVYTAPPTDSDIAELLGDESEAERVSVLSGYNTILRAYSSDNGYLFQMNGKIGETATNLLISVSRDNKILGAKDLSTGESLTAELAALVGLDLKAVGTAEISDDLKAIATDALNLALDLAVVAPSADAITDILGEGHQAKAVTVSYAPNTVTNCYTNGDTYLFQLAKKNDDGLILVLIHVNKTGKILGAKALTPTQDSIVADAGLLVGLDLTTVDAAAVSDGLKALAKDAIYLAVDMSVTTPTADELTAILGADHKATQTKLNFAPATVKYSYLNGENYLFKLVGKSSEGLASLLLYVSGEGKILGATALSGTSDTLAAQVSALVGLDLDGVKSSTLTKALKDLAGDALRTVTAHLADGSVSKYFYSRNTEGREIYTVEMKVKGYDTPVVILLDKTTAPITVENFLSLVERGFYDGLDFHRIIKDFMIQGGDDSHLPADQQAASIKGEFDSNGHKNDILHLRGTISMARSSVKDSASSGFFICDADSYWLDGEYAAFGYVISGMETVDAIADYSVGKTDSNGNLNAGVEQPVIEYIKVIENIGE